MITRDQYVERLELMIQIPKPWTTCPAFKDFEYYLRSPIEKIYLCKDWNIGGTNLLDERICGEMCKPFIGLSGDDEIGCPCLQLGETEAIEAARMAVRAYRDGTHPWCAIS